MQDDIDGQGEPGEVETHRLSHAALDAIALDGLAQHAAGGETHARALRHGVVRRSYPEEVAHRRREMLAALAIDALVIRVLAQTGSAKIDGSLGHTLIVLETGDDCPAVPVSRRCRFCPMLAKERQSNSLTAVAYWNKHFDAEIDQEGKLVAVAGADRDAMTALGATAGQYGRSALGLHASAKAVYFRAMATIRLKCALRHGTALLNFFVMEDAVRQTRYREMPLPDKDQVYRIGAFAAKHVHAERLFTMSGATLLLSGKMT